MTVSDEAVEAVHRAICEDSLAECVEWEGHCVRAVEAAAPHLAMEVTTRTEQVNLPNGTVILSAQGGVLQHFNGYWFEPGSSYRHHLDDITLPAQVIHRPTP